MKIETLMKNKFLLFIILSIVAFSGLATAQTGNSEIFVFSIAKTDSGYSFSDGENISNSPGYDNQPSFGPSGKTVLFTSIRNENSPDIYEYIFRTKGLKQITTSKDSEYTPRAKDSKDIYFIREESGGQGMTLWKYDRASKSEEKAIGIKEPVAYYDLNGAGGTMVWVRYASMAQYVYPARSVNLFVEDHVLPSSPQNIPGTIRFSFVHRQGNNEIWIKEFDPETRAVRPIVQVKEGKIDYCWLDGRTILTGVGSKLFAYKDIADSEWVEIADLKEFEIKDITRVAATTDSKMIALVSNQ